MLDSVHYSTKTLCLISSSTSEVNTFCWSWLCWSYCRFTSTVGWLLNFATTITSEQSIIQTIHLLKNICNSTSPTHFCIVPPVKRRQSLRYQRLKTFLSLCHQFKWPNCEFCCSATASTTHFNLKRDFRYIMEFIWNQYLYNSICC